MSAIPVPKPEDLRGLRHVGVSEFRADPIGTTRGEPLVVMSYDRPKLYVIPIPESASDDAAVNARFAAIMEALEEVSDPEAARRERDLVLAMRRAEEDSDE